MTRKVRKSGRQLWLLLVMLLVLAVCAGCAGSDASSGQSSAGGTSDGAVTVTSAQCDALASIAADPATPTIGVVIDRTKSGLTRALPPGAAETLRKAQSNGWNATVVSVNGAGANPLISRTISLDPKPGVQSPNADRARAGALACVPARLNDPGLLPTAPGSDVLAAIAAAGRQQPKTLLIISDGVATAGSLNISQIGYDADANATVRQLVTTNALPDLHSVPTTTWTDLGETTTSLPQPARTSLQALWKATLKAAGTTVTFDSRVSAATTTDTLRTAAVADPTPSVKATTVQAGDTTCVTLPSSVLFAPDDATITDTTALTPVAAVLAAHPQWPVHIVGHTADYGPREGQLSLSLQRAQAAMDALHTLGASNNPISVAGVGSDEPQVVEWHGGVHDAAAAAANRRVVIAYGPTPETTSTSCS